MKPRTETYAMTDIPPPGISFWLKFAGRLTSIDGVHYELGRYTCPHIIERGRGWVRVGNVIKELSPGDMFCIMNDAEIEYYDDPAEPWTFSWLHLSGEALDAVMRSWGFAPESPWLRPEQPGIVQECFRRIRGIAAKTIPAGPSRLAAELFNLSDALYRPELEQRDSNTRQVELAKALLEAQLHTGINVTELAAMMRIDRTTLFKAFKRELGCSPIEYIRERRIDRACRMLKSADRKLSKIAAACGFANDKYLISAFRQLKGVTPGEFRTKESVKS